MRVSESGEIFCLFSGCGGAEDVFQSVSHDSHSFCALLTAVSVVKGRFYMNCSQFIETKRALKNRVCFNL